MADVQFDAIDERDTDRFGAALARVLPPGAVVALVGTLGAGKTRLVQAVAKAVGIDPRDVVSPTFVLVHEYPVRGQRAEGRGRRVHEMHLPDGHGRTGNDQTVRSTHPTVIYHIDAYRVRDEDEFRELGPEEYFESDGWTFVEWADRVADCLPQKHLRIEIEVTGPMARRFAVIAVGEGFASVMDRLVVLLDAT